MSASQEDVTGVIATMNIGAGEEDSFRHPKKETVFGMKLLEDINWMIANGSDIIMLQEVSEHWTNFFESTCPKDGTPGGQRLPSSRPFTTSRGCRLTTLRS